MRTMDPGPRTLLLQDPMFQDAMLEQHPALSGLQPQQIGADKSEGNQDFLLVEAAKKQRLETLFGPQLAEIAELKTTIADANMIVDRALVHLKLHSGMEDRAWSDFVAPIMSRQNEVWVTEDRKQVITVAGGKANYRPASADESRNGRLFSPEAYAADRAAA